MEHTEEIQPCAQCNQIGKWLLYDGRRLCTAHAHHALHWTKYDTTSPLFPYTASWLQQADVATRAGQVVPPLPKRQTIMFIKMVNGRVTKVEQDDPEAIPTEDGRKLLAKQQGVADRRAERKAARDKKEASAATYNAYLAKCADERRKKDEERLKKTAEREAKKLAVAAAKEAKEAKEAAEHQAKMIAKAKPIILPPVAFTDIPRIIPVREPAVIMVKAVMPKVAATPKVAAMPKVAVGPKVAVAKPVKLPGRAPKFPCQACGRAATYGIRTAGIKTHCATHANGDMVKLIRPICVSLNCVNYADMFKDNAPMYCLLHADNTCKKKYSIVCAGDGCELVPSYGPRSGTPTYCVEHKTEESVRLKWHCKTIDCYEPPYYGEIADERGTKCVEHKTPTMVDKSGRFCTVEGCTGKARYHTEHSSRAMWCREHRTPDSFEWKQYLCAEESCGRTAIYEHGDKKYCVVCRPAEATLAPHRPEKYSDTGLAIYCKKASCIKAPTHGETEPLYCLTHAGGHPRIKRWQCHCGEEAEYAADGAYVCQTHYTAIEPPCKFCNIITETTRVCKACDSRACQTELAVAKYLDREIADRFFYDQNTGKSKARPDILYSKDTHVVIIEIDESQHKSYSSEIPRMKTIVSELGGRPVTFIRFNPDERNGTMQPNMAGRLVVLMATVRRYLAEPPAAFRVEQVHLYYDGEDMRIEDITDKVCV